MRSTGPTFSDTETSESLPMSSEWMLLCGGFPCQDISNAGKRAGIDGERSGLWAEYLRLLCVLRPRYAVIENVSGLFARGMADVLCGLAESGFDAEWRTFTACEFNNPHTRQRVFILAYPNGIGFQGGRPKFKEAHREVLPAVRHAPERRRPIELPKPAFCRGVDGIPDRSHRLKSLGNAVVPQIVEWIGNRILEFERRTP